MLKVRPVASAVRCAVANQVRCVGRKRRSWLTAILLALPLLLSSGAMAATTDLGPLPSSTQLQGLTLILTPSAQQNAALAQLLANLQTPSSSQYRQWLTVQQFATQFGPATAEVQQAQAWLTAQGFTITATSPTGLWISFSGTAAQVDSAFSTTLDAFSQNDVAGYANTTPPAIPSALTSFVAGVAGLSNLAPSPSSSIVTAPYNSGTGWMLPAQFESLYDIQPLLESGNNGASIQIAIAGTETLSTSDIATYRTADGINALSVQQSGSAPAATTGLPTAQIELAGSIAPGAQLNYYGAATELAAALTAVDQNSAAVLLLSRSGCEATYSAAEITGYQQLSEQATAQGITVIAPTGNAGPAACDAGATTSTQGPAVAFPASLPQVIAIGGNAVSGTTQSGWTSSTSLLAGGGGSSALFPKPTWQTASTDAVRDLPDLSFAANLPYPVCISGSCSSGFASADGDAIGLDGTLAASASFAGVVALLDQKDGVSNRLGNFTPLLYSIYTSKPAAFDDITTGSNSVPCSANCILSNATGATALAKSSAASATSAAASETSSNNISYPASTGYDMATGLGSIDANAIALAMPRALTGTTTGLIFNNYNPVYGTAANATATVNPNTATGTVTFDDTSTGTAGTTNINAGVAVFSFPATLNAGTHVVQATYNGDTSDSGSTDTANFTVGQATTSTATSFSPSNSDVVGTSVTISGTVTPSTATGTVNFSDSVSGNLGSGTLSGGVATLTTSALTAVTHTITTAFQGSTNFVASSGNAQLDITKTSSSTTVSSNPTGPVGDGTSVALIATVTPTTATGTVTFTDSLGTSLGTVSEGSGTATYTTTTLGLGNHLITATYNGDSADTISSGQLNLTISQKTTSTTASATSNSITYGGSVTITGTVNDTSATGTMTFTDALTGTTLGTGTVSGGVASYTTTALSAGSHTITAAYNGDTADSASSGATTIAVAKIATTTGLQLSSNTIVYGTNLTATASVTPNAATGTIIFTDSQAAGGTFGTGTLVNGVAQINSSTIAPGTHTIQAQYPGDTNDMASVNSAMLTVSQRTPTMTLGATPSTLSYGNTLTLVATLGTPSATGTITFTDSINGAIATVNVSGGAATTTANMLSVGTHTVTAIYSGDTDDSAQTAIATFTVIKGTTVTSISVTPNPAVVNFATNLTATITNGGTGTGMYIFTGSVSFYQGTTVLGTAAVVNNQATLAYTFTSIGTESVYAIYSGDTNWNTSTSAPFNLAVQGVPTTTTLTSGTGTVLAGANVIFTISVSATSAYTGIVNSVPTGSVTFYDSFNNSFTVLGSASLVQSGLYTASTTFQSKFFIAGVHTITAVYGGNTNFAAATATSYMLTVQDFTITATPASGSVARGASTQAVINIGSLYGFSGLVDLSCTPPGGTSTTCTLGSSTITGSGVTTLTVNTNVVSAATGSVDNEARNTPPTLITLAGLGLTLLLGCFVPRAKKLGKFSRLAVILAAAILLGVTALGLSGCSQVSPTGVNNGSSTGVTPLGTQTFSVTAVGTNGLTSVSHVLSYQVAVQ